MELLQGVYMTPYINEITNCSNIFPQPKILKQIDNRNLLIAPSPLSSPTKSYLIQNIKGVDNKLYFFPPRYSDYREETILTDITEYPYVFYSYTLPIQYYCGLNVYFRDESYTQDFINATLIINDGNNEFTIPIRSNQGGYIQLYDNIDKLNNGVRFSVKLIINNAQDPSDVNNVIQFGVCPVYEQPFGLKNFNSILQLHSLPYDSPHGFSVIKENYSEDFEYLPTIDKSIHITLYQNHSDNNVIEKSLDVLNSYDGNFTYHGSVLSPNLVINDPLVLKSNYLEIEELKRYYYITDIETLGKDNFRVYLQVDTLMTYKEFILKQGAYVLRNEYDYNVYLNDNKVPMNNINKNIIYESSRKSEFFNLSETKYASNNHNVLHIEQSYCIILCLANTKNINTYIQLNDYFPLNFSYQGNQYFVLTGQEYYKIIYDINSSVTLTTIFQQLGSCIISARLFPFDIYEKIKSQYGEDKNIISSTIDIYVGSTTVKEQIGEDTYKRWKNVNIPVCVDVDLGTIEIPISSTFKFLYCEPNLNIQLYLPFYGFVDISPNMYLKNDKISIKVTYNIDITTGKTYALLTNPNDDNFTTARQIIEFDLSSEIPFPIGNVTAIALKSMLNLIGGIFHMGNIMTNLGEEKTKVSQLESRATKRTTPRSKLGREIASAETSLAYEQVRSGINIASDFTLGALNVGQYKLDCGSGVTNLNAFYYKLYTYIIVKFKITTLDTNDKIDTYSHYLGRPLNEYRKLKDVKGYTEIGAVHLDNLDNALTQEKDEIEEYLKGGVYFPQKESRS